MKLLHLISGLISRPACL